MKKNIPLEEAQQLVLENCSVMETEYVNLNDLLGRILAGDIKAGENIPPFDRSPYDGYAFRAEETADASKVNPVRLEVIEEVPAGYVPRKEVGRGQAVKILTGAPIPQGADAVVKYEDTELSGNTVLICSSYKSGDNIVSAGEDVPADEIIACKGTKVTPPIVGLMASLGITGAEVFKRPKIAIISTGDELLDIHEPLSPGKIRNSNAYTLSSYIRELGAEPVILGMARDNAEATAKLITEGLKNADLVITTGGVSVGDYDVVRNAVNLAGADTLFWKIEIKPGSPCLAAVKDNKLVLGLSGNPAAAFVIFQLVGILYIKKMAGWSEIYPQKTEVLLKKGFRKASPRRRFLRGRIIIEKGIVYMESTGGQGNSVLSSLIGSDALAEVPEGSGPLQPGEKLTAYLFR